MTSNAIVDYYEFLEKKDETYKGNYEILDDGSAALYAILFKLMGDTRSFETLCSDCSDWPPATELQGTAQDGDYTSVVSVMRDHDCGILEHGATLEITSKNIQDLELCLPFLRKRISRNEFARDAEFLEEIWSELYS